MNDRPNWHEIAAAPLPGDDQCEARYDVAADNLLAALFHAIQALERNNMTDLADQVGSVFVQAFAKMAPEDPEPLSDDPEELEQLQRIAALGTPEEAARYLVSRGFNEYDAADFVFSLLRAVRREG